MTDNTAGALSESTGAGQGGGLWRDDNDQSDTELVPDEYYWTRENDCTLGFGVDGRPVSLGCFSTVKHTLTIYSL